MFDAWSDPLLRMRLAFLAFAITCLLMPSATCLAAKRYALLIAVTRYQHAEMVAPETTRIQEERMKKVSAKYSCESVALSLYLRWLILESTVGCNNQRQCNMNPTVPPKRHQSPNGHSIRGPENGRKCVFCGRKEKLPR